MFHRHGNPEQRPVVAAGSGLIGTPCCDPSTVEVRHADRVYNLVEALDTGDCLVGQFHRGHLTRPQTGRELLGRSETPLHESDVTVRVAADPYRGQQRARLFLGDPRRGDLRGRVLVADATPHLGEAAVAHAFPRREQGGAGWPIPGRPCGHAAPR
jgi:hypothetical protein